MTKVPKMPEPIKHPATVETGASGNLLIVPIIGLLLGVSLLIALKLIGII